ncbi:uncharacterized protein LOC119091555 [Pollicipes pollicipes]|uniref:uncharacterized protein LOC119091555 n=1 Tax=Pollicipes pollicipes TaxID=41117 RepID=UPI00188498D9|nr:uncharacterized protein LOC119091555 [Pollicipes pollicipes]
MSGESMMHDNPKHVYHSIPMDAPGAIALTERSRCCGGSRKTMSLILASALLWVIVLDVILVVYKSHHLGGSSHKTTLKSRMDQLEFVRINKPATALPSVDNLTNQHIPTPPPGRPVTKMATSEPGSHQSDENALAKDVSKREDNLLLQGGGVSGALQAFLAQIHAPPSHTMMSSPLRRPLPPPLPPGLAPPLPLPERGRRAWATFGSTGNVFHHPAEKSGGPKYDHDKANRGSLTHVSVPGGSVTFEKTTQHHAMEPNLFVRFISSFFDAPLNVSAGHTLDAEPRPPRLHGSPIMSLFGDDDDDDDDDSEDGIIDLDL